MLKILKNPLIIGIFAGFCFSLLRIELPPVIDKTLADLANVLMNNFNMQPNQVRVSICELPRNRFMAGGILAADMPEFDEEDSL